MSNYKIRFQNISWETTSNGAKQKQFCYENKRIRLLRLEDTFTETDWCTKAHIGYLLDGEMTIDFEQKKMHYTKGDGIFIIGGLKHKHKAIIEKGKFVELILIENE